MHLKKLIVAVCAALMLSGAAFAQHGSYGPGADGHGGYGRGSPGHGGAPPDWHGGHFPAGPVGHFGSRDMATWRAGYWWHGWRGGRVGWWWFAGGFWYWYAAPLYPYPGYVPDYSLGGDYPAPGAAWWCDDPPGYYPYVQGCWRWRAVGSVYPHP